MKVLIELKVQSTDASISVTLSIVLRNAFKYREETVLKFRAILSLQGNGWGVGQLKPNFQEGI